MRISIFQRVLNRNSRIYTSIILCGGAYMDLLDIMNISSDWGIDIKDFTGPSENIEDSISHSVNGVCEDELKLPYTLTKKE